MSLTGRPCVSGKITGRTIAIRIIGSTSRTKIENPSILVSSTGNAKVNIREPTSTQTKKKYDVTTALDSVGTISRGIVRLKEYKYCSENVKSCNPSCVSLHVLPLVYTPSKSARLAANVHVPWKMPCFHQFIYPVSPESW